MTDIHTTQIGKSVNEIHPLSNDCWSEIESLIYIREFEEKDYFSKEGQLLKDLVFVLNGILRIYYLNEKGEEWNKLFLQKNDFLASSISPKKKSITNIQALTKTTILCISYPEIEKLSVNYNEINVFIQKLTFLYLEQKQDREISLLSEETLKNYMDFKESYPGLESKIQHYHIASYLGITPTQLSRLRKKINAHQHM